MTDDDRRIYIPNTQLTTTPIVNRTIRDPRRAVTASLPLRLGAPIDHARTVVLSAVKEAPGVNEAYVTVGDVSDKVVWLTATAYASLDANVGAIGSDLRERALGALAAADLLPAA